MIKRIFQDLDECILHTMINTMPHEGEEYVEFALGSDMHAYRTIIRPCAKSLFEYYNNVVGKENVYILTTATREYAEELNRLGEFGLDVDHIYTREDIQTYRAAWNWDSQPTAPLPIADTNNILIDNLRWRENMVKMSMIGIDNENYHQTPEYYGDNSNEEYFLTGIKKFIEARR